MSLGVFGYAWLLVFLAVLCLAFIGGCAPLDTGNPACVQGCTVSVGGV